MSLFRLPIFVRKKIDQLCKRFLWFGGSSVRKKTYYLISWKHICTSIDQGGLGVINLKLMNKALLLNGYGNIRIQIIKGYGRK
jgi:hypothetical protein